MIEHLDELIDSNLKLICESGKTSNFQLTHMLDINGRRLHSKHKSEQFAELMERDGLIRINGSFCSLEKFGLEVFKNGGWLNYLEKKNKEENKLELSQFV